MAFAKGSRFPKKDEDTSKKTTKKDETTEKEKVATSTRTGASASGVTATGFTARGRTEGALSPPGVRKAAASATSPPPKPTPSRAPGPLSPPKQSQPAADVTKIGAVEAQSALSLKSGFSGQVPSALPAKSGSISQPKGETSAGGSHSALLSALRADQARLEREWATLGRPNPIFKPTPSVSPDLQVMADPNLKLAVGTGMTSADQLDWLVSESGDRAAAALRLADEQTEEIRRREEKLRQLGLQIAEAEQRFSATTLAPAPALGFTGTVTSDVREGGYISEQQNKSGKKQEESRADREKIGAESEGRGSKRDETVQEKAKNKGKGKETGAGEETERKQLAPKRKSARGLAEQRPGEVANEGPDVLEVEQVKLTALRLQLVSNEAALRLGQQKLLSASGAAGAEIEGEDALQQTLQKLSAADRQLGEEQVRLSGGGLGGGDSLAGKESAEANSGGAGSLEAIARAEARAAASEKRVEELEEEVAGLKKARTKMVKLTADLRMKVEHVTAEKNAIEGKLHVLEEEMKGMKDFIDDKASEIREAAAKQVEDVTSEMNQRLAAMHRRLQTALECNTRLEHDVWSALQQSDGARRAAARPVGLPQ